MAGDSGTEGENIQADQSLEDFGENPLTGRGDPDEGGILHGRALAPLRLNAFAPGAVFDGTADRYNRFDQLRRTALGRTLEQCYRPLLSQ